jgi:surfactin synthase thioesterase subunit/NAD(P)-dependent dehydrogenase (short-subunit alcohol dehydrogenase family)
MEHLYRRGAQYFLLVSRSGVKDAGHQQRINDMVSTGAVVRTFLCDVTDVGQLVQLFETLTSSKYMEGFAPLGGIIHAAGVLEDQMMSTLSHTSFNKVFAPKAIGGLMMHLLTQRYFPSQLHLFCCISSISALAGFVGQAAYAAANAFLDGLACHRNIRNVGHAVNCSINYGVLSDYAGMTDTTAMAASAAKAGQQPPSITVFDILASQGFTKMPLYDCLAKFDLALRSARRHGSQLLATRTDWSVFARPTSIWSVDVTYQEVLQQKSQAVDSSSTASETTSEAVKSAAAARLQTQLVDTSISAEARLELMVQALVQCLKRLLGISARNDSGAMIDPNASIDLLGVDSLVLSQLRTWISKEVGVSYPMMQLLKGPSPQEIAGHLMGLRTPAQNGGSADEADDCDTWQRDYKDFTLLNPWLVRGHNSPADSAAVRLFCIHSMGASALLFNKILYYPPSPNVDVIAVQSPGRGHHVGPEVKRIVNVQEYIDELLQRMLPLIDRPILLWGHSFGGILAYELVRTIARRHPQYLPHVRHLQTSGTVPPHLMPILQTRDTLLMGLLPNVSKSLVEDLQQYTDDSAFMTTIMQPMALDLPLLLEYADRTRAEVAPSSAAEASGSSSKTAVSASASPQRVVVPLPCGMTVWSGSRDDIAYGEEIAEWRRYVDGVHPFRHVHVDGDHWSVRSERSRRAEWMDGWIDHQVLRATIVR